jgi:hypothetical protein
MKFGLRIPSLKKRIAARTSVKRFVRHSLGLKAPRGWGWLTNPKRALHNRIYNRTTRGCLILLLGLCGEPCSAVSSCASIPCHEPRSHPDPAPRLAPTRPGPFKSNFLAAMMLEGYRPNRIVRFYPETWKVIVISKEDEFLGRE